MTTSRVRTRATRSSSTAFALVGGLLTGLGTAQIHISSPPGHVSTEGSTQVSWPLLDGRMMILDGEMGVVPMMIKELAMRSDYRLGFFSRGRRLSPGFGSGRRWSSVTLELSPCDLSGALTSAFSGNLRGTPTRVFSGPTSWPELPASSPNARGFHPGPWNVRFPFTTTYTYLSTGNLAFDFRFRGGSYTSVGGIPGDTYYLDAPFAPTQNIGIRTTHTAGTGCIDSGYLNPALGTLDTITTRTGPGIELIVGSVETASQAPVIQAFGIAALANPLPFPGVTCERLIIDLGQPALWFTGFANNHGTSLSRFSAPFSPALVGQELWVQAAWNDSASGRPKLTRASRSGVVGLPRVLDRYWHFDANWNATASSQSPTKANNMVPILRLTQ